MSRRIVFPNTVVFVSTRVQEGLPFICAEFMSFILTSILGRAQRLHNVEVCHYLFMANHLHMLLVVKDPKDIVDFMDRLKTESAHAINRLLGRRQRSVWCKGFDSPPILTVEDVIEKIVYLYANPVEAHLVQNIDSYPGVSSWKMFREQKRGIVEKRLRRSAIPKLNKHRLSPAEDRAFTSHIKKKCKGRALLRYSPDAWFDVFGIKSTEKRKRINAKIVTKLRAEEDRLSEERKKAKKKIYGAQNLRSEQFNKPYTPKTFGKRMWCICSDIQLRCIFIEKIKYYLAQARAVYLRWLQGDYSVPYPVGFFPPSMPRTANLRSLAAL